MEINGSNWCQNAQVVQVKKAFEKWRALYNVEACHCQVPFNYTSYFPPFSMYVV